jgi:hypothetical protein
MFQLDKLKTTDPKFSNCLEPLYQYLKDNGDTNTSDAGSISDYSLLRGQNLFSKKQELPKINESVSPRDSSIGGSPLG